VPVKRAPSGRGASSKTASASRTNAPSKKASDSDDAGADAIVAIVRKLARAVDRLSFASPVEYVYDPLDYARAPHEAYLRRYGRGKKTVVFVGMNPGPFGMTQTGVPFGDVAMVRDWLHLDGKVGRPDVEHPKRPVLGFACTRSEVSGTRFWGWARDRFGEPERFFERFFVANYCPLVFMEASGRNLTPDKLPAKERAPLFSACNDALGKIVALMNPEFVIGIGGFATARAREALPGFKGTIGTILHPSPASPKANRGWANLVDQELAAYGIDIPRPR
jgi:single-strand selective monofunctional uracil DNA glycosylase